MQPRKSYLFSECMKCDETNPAALMPRSDGFICGNCEGKERNRPARICSRCGKAAPFERHHIHGRKNSDELEDRCINCHRIGHALED
jgi:hypothetical protein